MSATTHEQEAQEIENMFNSAPPTVEIYKRMVYTAGQYGLDERWVQQELDKRGAVVMADDGYLEGFTWQVRNDIMDLIQLEKKEPAKKETETVQVDPNIERNMVLEERHTLMAYAAKEYGLDQTLLLGLWGGSKSMDGSIREDWSRLDDFKKKILESAEKKREQGLLPDTSNTSTEPAATEAESSQEAPPASEFPGFPKEIHAFLKEARELGFLQEAQEQWDRLVYSKDIPSSADALSAMEDWMFGAVQARRETKNAGGVIESDGHRVDEDGQVVDLNYWLVKFGWTEMPKLTDPDILDKLHTIGEAIAEHKTGAETYRVNADYKAKIREKKAQEIEKLFGHLIKDDSTARLPKYTKDCKGGQKGEPSKKTWVYDTFAVSYKKAGGTFIEDEDAFAKALLELGPEKLAELKIDVKQTTEMVEVTRTEIGTKRDDLLYLMRQGKLPRDMPGLKEYPVNHYAEMTITAKPKGAK